ncbi:hypothetical protein [Ketobacter alkanivorans]|uniref:hypothetical protein n=1 Tax=Ketobacter alkanivorans TaxID=1917421 RepID=UPI00131581A9|nr:hypothetical protein [Ketobacter alkanivorans]
MNNYIGYQALLPSAPSGPVTAELKFMNYDPHFLGCITPQTTASLSKERSD